MMMKKDESIKYCIYARKSSENEDRQVQSIDDQINRLKEMAKRLNLKIVKIYQESKSAKTPDSRPVFKEMISDIERKNFDGILVWQFNRLSRNPVDTGTIQWMLQQGLIKCIQTIDREFLPDDNAILLSVEGACQTSLLLSLEKTPKGEVKASGKRDGLPNMRQ